jgi:hypothetical protein
MPSPELFIDTEPLFEDVGALRERFAAAQDAEAVPTVSLSNATGSETLGLLASLANGVPSTMVSQLELAARLISLGALDVIAADSCPVPEDD